MYKWNGEVQYTEVSHKQFNEHLNKARERNKTIKTAKFKASFEVRKLGYDNYVSPTTAWVYDVNSFVYLSYKNGKQWVNVKTDKYEPYPDDFEPEAPENVGAIWAYFNRYVKFDRNEFKVPVDHVEVLRYRNPNYFNTRHSNVYGYDTTCAYLGGANQCKVPLKLLRKNDIVRENEVGFNFNGTPIYGPSDRECVYVYSCGVHEGLQKWVDNITNHILEAKTKQERRHWKHFYQDAIGCLLSKKMDIPNVLWWNCIITKAKKNVLQHFDENTLWCTTDSIVSLVEKDLPMSDMPGDFHEEHFGDFAYNEHGYQWNKDTPTNSGIPRGKYGDDFDILKDSIETNYKNPIVTLDWDRLELTQWQEK